eukprot:scaffold30792_cov63-Phaeocystis_antarctica.AAC.10
MRALLEPARRLLLLLSRPLREERARAGARPQIDAWLPAVGLQLLDGGVGVQCEADLDEHQQPGRRERPHAIRAAEHRCVVLSPAGADGVHGAAAHRRLGHASQRVHETHGQLGPRLLAT